MQNLDLPTLSWSLLALTLALLAILFWCLRRLLALSRQLGRQKELIDSEGKKRVEKSRSVLLGQVAEHFAPLLPGFDYNPKDARFLGQPVDYLVFNGLNDTAQDGRADRSPEIEIVFCEIKTGGSQLSPAERAIRAAIEAGRVRFELLRLDAEGNLTSGNQRDR